jgi:hypothetical protein
MRGAERKVEMEISARTCRLKKFFGGFLTGVLGFVLIVSISVRFGLADVARTRPFLRG